MASITCDVVKDLLPLYVDEALSADGRAVVEEHVEHCRDCTEYLGVLRSKDAFAPARTVADRRVLEGIHRRLLTRRVATALAAALCVAAVALGVFYAVTLRETYIPYEQSGLSVSGDVLQTDRSYYKSYGVYAPDGESCFIYMTSTVYADMQQDKRVTTIEDLSDEGRTMTIEEDDGTTSELVNTKIFYVSEEDARAFRRGELSRLTDEDVARLEASSTLVWEAQ